MKKITKFLALALVLTMCVGVLAACSGGKDDAEGSNGTSAPSATKPQATKPQATKPENTKPENTKPEDTKPEDTKPETDDDKVEEDKGENKPTDGETGNGGDAATKPTEGKGNK